MLGERVGDEAIGLIVFGDRVEGDWDEDRSDFS